MKIDGKSSVASQKSLKMLRSTIFILFGIFAIALAQSADDAKRQERVFNQWLKKYKLDVAENADLDKWKTQVLQKFKEAEAHNEKFRKGEVKFQKAINHLSHLTPEQRRATLLGYEANPTKPSNEKFVPVVDKELLKDLPDYWNWADHGVIQPVQNQNPCGSCYVFGSIAAIEAHNCIYNDICEKLSEQEALDCSYKGCNGGNPEIVYNYTQANNGAAYEKDYPYQGKQVAACDTSKRPRVPKTKVLDWKWMPNDEGTIRYYLKTVGPMTWNFQAYPNFDLYQNGIYDKVEGSDPGGHMILLVGYGTSTDGTPYWIMKNSWGSENWGEAGYCKYKRGIDLAKGESSWPGYPILAP